MSEELQSQYHGKELNKKFSLKDGKLQYLVVGTGRCGTVFLAKFLSSVGISCSHEGIFSFDGLDSALDRMSGKKPISMSHIAKLASNWEEDNGVSWFKDKTSSEIVAESSYMAAPFLSHPSLAETKIIHVVREPMQVVNSFLEGFRYFRDEAINEKYLGDYHKFIYKHTPEVGDSMDCISRAALYYVEWNEMIERLSKSHNYYRHRIEDSLNKLLDFIGSDCKKYYNNQRSNHKEGCPKRYQKTSEISIMPIRERLEAMYSRYYLKRGRLKII